MSTITKAVWHIIKSDAALQRDLHRGIINTRACARYIIRKHELKASTDAVLSAIRRFEHEETLNDSKRLHFFRDSVILTKNNIACITIKKDGDRLLQNILKDTPGIRLITGTKHIKIIVEHHLLDSIKEKIPGALVEKIEHELSELSITLSEDVIKTRGVLARIANEISLSNINIEEIVILPPEFLIYVKKEDLLKTYESLLKLQEE